MALGKRSEALPPGILTDRTFRWCERDQTRKDAVPRSRPRNTGGGIIELGRDPRSSGVMRPGAGPTRPLGHQSHLERDRLHVALAASKAALDRPTRSRPCGSGMTSSWLDRLGFERR